ncbi:LuxR C-terminal-related transcriptional regulator [uncultured Adlercreutzia sp.]|uniref:helix-turn-helix transcriptional regulator n=1 Tax=uncultured Adlercreutzia sp. TaxID=875803 RepID=UPI0025E24921|nr:LuxR C-terminal-related transcriptional regulator [uncultured Adlercreutzia sp.]
MHINLKAHKINGRQAASIALLDSIIWLWFHQINYTSIFSESVLAPNIAVLPSLALSTALAVGIMHARWDVIPKSLRLATALGTPLVLLGCVLLSQVGNQSDTLATALSLALGVACSLAALLRLETLAKCDDFATLAVALSGSLMLFYILDLGLLLVPREVYDALVIAAPLTLAVGSSHPAPPAARSGPLPKRMRRAVPVLVPFVMGACTGFVVALGMAAMAVSPLELFTRPSPLFLLSQLLFICLTIVTVFGLDLRKATYFAGTSLCWSLGMATGNVANETLLTSAQHLIANEAASFICLSVIVMFFAFSGIWINSLEKTIVTNTESSFERIAQDAGLTKREIEVVQLLLEGRSLRIIQETLFISEGTARTHTKRIYAKLGVHSKQELIDFFKGKLSAEQTAK